MRKNSGMTLIEIMIVLAIIGGLFLIVQGALFDMIRGERVKNAAAQLFTTMVYARGEAVKRNTCVDVVPVSTSNWRLGWTVQVPRTSGGVAACGGTGTPTVIRTYTALEEVTVAGPSTSIKYNGAGRLSALGDTSTGTLCNNSCTSICTVNNAPPSFRVHLSTTSVLRCVSVRSSGSPEVKKG